MIYSKVRDKLVIEPLSHANVIKYGHGAGNILYMDLVAKRFGIMLAVVLAMLAIFSRFVIGNILNFN